MTNRKSNVVMIWPFWIKLIHYLILLLILGQWYLIIADPSNCKMATHKTILEYYEGKMYDDSKIYHVI